MHLRIHRQKERQLVVPPPYPEPERCKHSQFHGACPSCQHQDLGRRRDQAAVVDAIIGILPGGEQWRAV